MTSDPRDLLRVGMAIGADRSLDPAWWQFTDVTDRLVADQQVTQTIGRRTGAQYAPAGSFTYSVHNHDQLFNPTDARSDWYPYVRRNVPAYLAMDSDDPALMVDTFARTVSAGWGTSTTGQAWDGTRGLNGTIAPTDWSVSGGSAFINLPAADTARWIWTTGISCTNQRVEARVRTSVAPAGGNIELFSALFRAQNVTSKTFHYRASVVLDPTKNPVVSLRITDKAETVLYITQVDPPYSPNSWLCVEAEMFGSLIRMKVWADGAPKPAGWMAAVSTMDTTYPANVGIRSSRAAGDTNPGAVVVEIRDVTITQLPDVLSTCFVNKMEPDITMGTAGQNLATMNITAAGLIEWLDRSGQPLHSAIYRGVMGAARQGLIAAYWPAEDKTLAQYIAPAGISGRPFTPMQIINNVQPAANSDVTGSDALPVLQSGSALRADIDDWAGSGTEFGIQGVWRFPDAGLTDQSWLWAVDTSSSLRVVLRYGTGGSLTMMLFDQNSGTQLAMGTIVPYDIDGARAWMSVELTQNGANIDYVLRVYKIEEEANDAIVLLTSSGTFNAFTLGRPTTYHVAPHGNVVGAAVGHFSVSKQASYGVTWQALNSWSGEQAGYRAWRICREEGIPIQFEAFPVGGVAMGPQGIKTAIAVLRECEAADFGLLSESKDGFGLFYRQPANRLELTARMTVDTATYETRSDLRRQVLRGAYDTSGLVNDVTVNRPAGAIVRILNEASVAREGYQPAQMTANVNSDDLLPGIGSWRAHLGSIDAVRYTPTLDLYANPDLVPGWLALVQGDRILWANLPAEYPTNETDQVIVGYSQSFRRAQWTVQPFGEAYAGWDVATLDGVERVTAEGTTLVAPVTDSAMSFKIISPAINGPWVDSATNPGDFPLLVNLNGEEVRASAISTASTQAIASEDFEDTTYAVEMAGTWTRANDQKHGGSWSLRSAPIGDNGKSDVVVTIPPGTTSMSLWFRVDSETSFDFFQIYLDDETTPLAEASGSPGFWQSYTTPNVAGRRSVKFRYKKDGSDAVGADAAWIDDLVFQGPVQTVTVDTGGRGVNGVVKSHPAGASVNVWDEAVVQIGGV